ncbi:hypothetical protein [Kitasatospora sp. NBC_01266]|uniref:hypothetical protein n=1 Tax=Kitasatospora sp. NBC_01266 TaxID=2903572 RepID=UPI002E359D81|nr:hypothetical protein [Kitasatospora sp. NBC_01266]
MATSDRRWGRLPNWFGSRAHYLGSGGAAVGLGVSLTEGLGVTGVAVAGGLYAAGAVLGLAFGPPPVPEPEPEPVPNPDPEPTPEPDPEPTPEPDPEPTPEPVPDPVPEPTPTPDPDPLPAPERSAALALLAEQRARVARARWPEQGSTLAGYLLDQLARWLDNESAEAAQQPRERVAQAVTALDHYERDRSWQRLEPGDHSPEQALADRVAELLDRLAQPAAPQHR